MQLVVPQILSIGLIQAGLKAQFPRSSSQAFGSWELGVGGWGFSLCGRQPHALDEEPAYCY